MARRTSARIRLELGRGGRGPRAGAMCFRPDRARADVTTRRWWRSRCGARAAKCAAKSANAVVARRRALRRGSSRSRPGGPRSPRRRRRAASRPSGCGCPRTRGRRSSPLASIVRAAVLVRERADGGDPACLTATSARYDGFPVPSTTRPPRMTRSKPGAAAPNRIGPQCPDHARRRPSLVLVERVLDVIVHPHLGEEAGVGAVVHGRRRLVREGRLLPAS